MTSTFSSLKQRQTLLKIFIFSLVTVVIWLGYSIFISQRQTSVAPELIKLAQPLNPNINTEVISRIEQKKAYSEEELSNFPIFKTIKDKNGFEVIDTGESSTQQQPHATLSPEAAGGTFPTLLEENPIDRSATTSAGAAE